jgi:hypothetical protein
MNAVIGYLWPSGRMSADVPAGSNPIDVQIAAKCKPMMLATPCSLASEDLLTALQQTLGLLEAVWPESEDQSVFDAARAAIAKATGA